MKYKDLILEFGYNALVALCDSKGWELPTAEQLESGEIKTMHRKVWVSDLPKDQEDHETHALVYDTRLRRTTVSNKHFMQNAVVVKK